MFELESGQNPETGLWLWRVWRQGEVLDEMRGFATQEDCLASLADNWQAVVLGGVEHAT